MQTLNEADLAGLRQFMEEAALPIDLSSFAERLLPVIHRLVPGEVVCYAQVDPAEGKLIKQVTWGSGHEGPRDAEIFEQFMTTSPIFRYWGETGSRSAVRTSDFLTRDQWHRYDLYNHVYRVWGCEDSLAIGLPAPPGLVACFCIERATDFTDRDKLLLEIVRPYLATAYRNAEALELVAEAREPSGNYTILLDKRCRPAFASAAAMELIARYIPPEPGSHEVLPERLRTWISRQMDRFARGDELPGSAGPLVVESEGGQALVIRILWGPATGEQAVLVLSERIDADPFAPAADLGLTVRETEVLREAGRGRTAAEIADILCISRRTVEKHLDNIYNKFGVDSRAAAVARAYLS